MEIVILIWLYPLKKASLMNVQSRNLKILFLFITVIIFTFVVLPVNVMSSESVKSRKSDLEAQSAEIKSEATVAMDISLNALSNVMAIFNDTEKEIAVKLHAGNTSDVKSMVKLLGDAWKSEEDVLRQIAKISRYISNATSVLNRAETQLDISPFSETQLKKVKKITASARKNVNKASVIAEKLKQDWLVPVKSEAPKKK